MGDSPFWLNLNLSYKNDKSRGLIDTKNSSKTPLVTWPLVITEKCYTVPPYHNLFEPCRKQRVSFLAVVKYSEQCIRIYKKSSDTPALFGMASLHLFRILYKPVTTVLQLILHSTQRQSPCRYPGSSLKKNSIVLVMAVGSDKVIASRPRSPFVLSTITHVVSL